MIVQKKNKILSIMLMGGNKNLMFMLLIFYEKKRDSGSNIINYNEIKYKETMQGIKI